MADGEILEPETPIEVIVTKNSHRARKGGGKAQEESDQGLPATAEELKAWQQNDPTLEKACSLVSVGPAESEWVYFYL